MAKPANWNELSQDEKVEIAKELLKSCEGYHILSQVLHEAIKVLRKGKRMGQLEPSNIEDMEILQEIFRLNFYQQV